MDASSHISLSDIDIRPALRRKVLAPYRHDPDTVIIEELCLAQGLVRIDLVRVSNSLHGFEIKSDRDSLRRLDNQIGLYNRVMDYTTLVTAPKHFSAACNLLPPWWGIWIVEADANGPQITVVRGSKKNPSRDPRTLAELLWRDAALALLEQHRSATGVRGKPRHKIWDRIGEKLKIESIATAVRCHLKARSSSISYA